MSSSDLPPWVTSAEPPKYEERIRVHVFFTRKPGMSQEEFHQYWMNTHSKVFSELPLVRKNLIKYEQAHFDTTAAKGVEADGFPMMTQYDGIVTFDVKSYEQFHEVLASKEYQEWIAADEAKFLDRTKYIAYPARVVTVFDNAKL